MSQVPDADELIATAMQLPISERVALANALLSSIEPASGEDVSQVEADAAWDAEIAERIDDIDSGRVKTVASSDVWKRIGGKPSGLTEYHPGAFDDVANAYDDYSAIDLDLGERFKLELDRAEELVQRSPET